MPSRNEHTKDKSRKKKKPENGNLMGSVSGPGPDALPDVPSGPSQPTAQPGITSQSEDSELVSASLSGNREAFQALYRKYVRLLTVTVYQKVAEPPEVEDLVQETFLHAWQGLSKLRKQDRFLPWLLRIARHLVTDWHRAAARNSSLSYKQPGLSRRSKDPSERIVLAEQQQELLNALKTLPEKYQIVINMRFLEDLSPLEISKRLGEPNGTIRNRIFRGLQKLQKILERERKGRR